MKKIIACPVCEWAKKLFTVERFETIDYFLDEKEGEFQILGTKKIVHCFEYLKTVDKNSCVIIITDTRKFNTIKKILIEYGFEENVHFFNGWKLNHKFYEIFYEEKEWIEFENDNSNALMDMRSGWEKRAQKMSELIPADVKSLLDVGCGDSLIKKYLRNDIRYYGLDYCKRENVDFICNVNKGEFPDINVDMIFMAGVLGYIDNIGNFIEQTKKAKYFLISKRRTEAFIKLDTVVCDGYMNYEKTEYFVNDLINDMYQYGYVCVRMEWPWQERDEYYLLFVKK